MNRITALAVVLALGASAAHAKSCKDPTTGKFMKCPAAAPMAPAKPMAPATPAAPMMSKTPMASTATRPAPHCVKGKACGMSCIKATDICQK